MPPERAIDWSWFFDFPNAPHAPQPSRRLVASLTHALIDLPEQIVGHTEIPEHHSLASRDLQRGAALGLPSGEEVARTMGIEPLTAEECGLSAAGWTAETPLWYYIFKEAEVRAGGEHLGPVGGRTSPRSCSVCSMQIPVPTVALSAPEVNWMPGLWWPVFSVSRGRHERGL